MRAELGHSLTSTQCSIVISLHQEGYSLHQIQSKPGLWNSTVGRKRRRWVEIVKTTKQDTLPSCLQLTNDPLFTKSPLEDVMLWRLPISSITLFPILSHLKPSETHSKKMTLTLLSRGNVLSSRRPIDWSTSNLPGTMKTGQ